MSALAQGHPLWELYLFQRSPAVHTAAEGERDSNPELADSPASAYPHPDAGKDRRREETGPTEEHEMAGWHHRLDGREFGWTPGAGEGQGGLACCGPRGRRVGHD